MHSENIVILKPERSSGVVLIDKKKLLKILNGSARLLVDCSKKGMTKAYHKLKGLLKGDLINNQTYNELKPRGSRLSYLYELLTNLTSPLDLSYR